jgi:hypothetical protein
VYPASPNGCSTHPMTAASYTTGVDDVFCAVRADAMLDREQGCFLSPHIYLSQILCRGGQIGLESQ